MLRRRVAPRHRAVQAGPQESEATQLHLVAPEEHLLVAVVQLLRVVRVAPLQPVAAHPLQAGREEALRQETVQQRLAALAGRPLPVAVHPRPADLVEHRHLHRLSTQSNVLHETINF